MTRRVEEREQASENYYNEVKYLSDLSAFPIAAFKAGAEWGDRTMIDKVCKWLEELFTESDENPHVVSYQFDSIQEMIEDLRKTMEQ